VVRTEEVDVKELKSILERVEGKLIAAGKIYGAMNFALWLAVMAVFYTVDGIFRMCGWTSLLYWVAAILIAIPLTVRIWNRLKRLCSPFYPDIEREGRKAAFLMGLAWAAGSILGWVIVPSITWIGVSTGARLGVGFLSFIGVSLLGQWLVMTRGRGEHEMVPSFVLPLLAIPVAWHMKTGAVIWAGFVVAAGFSLTVLWYLYSAFRAIER